MGVHSLQGELPSCPWPCYLSPRKEVTCFLAESQPHWTWGPLGCPDSTIEAIVHSGRWLPPARERNWPCLSSGRDPRGPELGDTPHYSLTFQALELHSLRQALSPWSARTLAVEPCWVPPALQACCHIIAPLEPCSSKSRCHYWRTGTYKSLRMLGGFHEIRSSPCCTASAQEQLGV